MRLSAATTFLWKYLFPGIWFFGIGSLLVEVFRLGFIDRRPVGTFLFFLAGLGFNVWMLGRLKSVYLEGDALRVSNLFRTILVPLTEVKRVDGPDWTSHRRISVVLKSPTTFGKKIIFMPPNLSPKPIVKILRERLDALSRG